MNRLLPLILLICACVPEGRNQDVIADAIPNPPSAEGNAPIANAGSDLSIEVGAPFRLDGSASSDPDGDVLSYSWSQSAGPTVTLSADNAEVVMGVAPGVASSLRFDLEVADGEGTATDSVEVRVLEPLNKPPIANAGMDVRVEAGASVQLDGTASLDPDGGSITYAWRSVSDPQLALSAETSATPEFVAPDTEATLIFELEVSDGRAAATDEVTVAVYVPIDVNKTTARIWEPVTFRADSLAEWDFGDGNVAFGSVVTHQFVLPGIYEVSMNTNERTGTIEITPDSATSISLASQHEGGGSGMWTLDDLAIVPGLSNGLLRLIDISDPGNPVRLSTIRNAGPARGVRAFGDWVITAKEGGSSGCDIWDVSDPTAPQVVATLPEQSHNVSVWDNYVMLNGASGSPVNGLVIYDVSDPESPQRLARWDDSDVHDSQMMGDRLYVAGGTSNQFYIVDVSDRSNPTTIDSWRVPRYAHNVWPSGDGKLAFTSEEAQGGHLRIWNIEDPANIIELSEWTTTTGAPIIHNVVVVGELAYIAWYTYGFTVIDVSDPTNPTEIFHHDTYESSDANTFDGAWMGAPFGDRITVSDTEGGLFVYTKD